MSEETKPITETELRDAGYAPGAYWCKCDDCSVKYDGDKRSRRCLECATLLASMRRKPAYQFRVLAAKATQGVMKLWAMSVMRDPVGRSDLNDCELICHTADPERGLRTFNASFIIWCFNHRPEIQAALELADAKGKLIDALSTAESFISGFEDDELQEGIPEMLAEIRSAMGKLGVPLITIEKGDAA